MLIFSAQLTHLWIFKTLFIWTNHFSLVPNHQKGTISNNDILLHFFIGFWNSSMCFDWVLNTLKQSIQFFLKTRVFLATWRKIIKPPKIREEWKLRYHVKYVVLPLCDYLIINEKVTKKSSDPFLWSYIVFLAPWRKILIHPLFMLFFLKSNHTECFFI